MGKEISMLADESKPLRGQNGQEEEDLYLIKSGTSSTNVGHRTPTPARR